MSIKVPLEFRRFLDPYWAERGIEVWIVRLVTRTAFAAPNGAVTDMKHAVIDTGAPLSLLPKSIWKQCAVKVLGQSTIRGIVPKPECELPVKMGEVTCFLPAEDGIVVSITLNAYLAPIDGISLLLGFGGLLDRFRLVVDYSVRNAYLEVPQPGEE
jgi:hypothetical protein